MKVSVPGRLPAVLGFTVPAGLGLALAATLLLTYPPLEPPGVESGEAAAEDLTHLYIALEEPLYVAMGEGPRMKVDLAVSIEGTGEQLLDLNAAVEEQRGRVMAAILNEAQGLVMAGAEGPEVIATLPERARLAINDVLGRDTFPEPVTEVLIVELVVQG